MRSTCLDVFFSFCYVLMNTNHAAVYFHTFGRNVLYNSPILFPFPFYELLPVTVVEISPHLPEFIAAC